MAIISVFVIIILSIFLFKYFEKWSFVDSFYFTVITLTTIGYGDITPITTHGKIAASIFALMGVGVFLFCIGVIAEHYFTERLAYQNKIAEKGINRKINQKIAGEVKKQFRFIKSVAGLNDESKENKDN